MSAPIQSDDRVKQPHALKKVEPSPGKTVRVEAYTSDRFPDLSVFVWDGEMSAPARDSDQFIASSVEGYQAGDPNEGAWALLGPVEPTDASTIVGVPMSGAARGFLPENYSSAQEAIDAAATYVDNIGDGWVRVPQPVLPVDYGTVTVPSGVQLVVRKESWLERFDDTYSVKEAERQGVYIGDTSSGAATLELQKELEVDGTIVEVKRNGVNTLTVSTATDATVKGSASFDIGADGDSIRLVYDRNADNWEEI
jgi:hypothetical protein